VGGLTPALPSLLTETRSCCRRTRPGRCPWAPGRSRAAWAPPGVGPHPRTSRSGRPWPWTPRRAGQPGRPRWPQLRAHPGWSDRPRPGRRQVHPPHQNRPGAGPAAFRRRGSPEEGRREVWARREEEGVGEVKRECARVRTAQNAIFLRRLMVRRDHHPPILLRALADIAHSSPPQADPACAHHTAAPHLLTPTLSPQLLHVSPFHTTPTRPSPSRAAPQIPRACGPGPCPSAQR
jgi:hypothetical protein